MKKLMYIFLILLLAGSVANSQRVVNVPANVDDAIYNTIMGDSTARRAALPQQTTYLLARGGFYATIRTLNNLDFVLNIKAADGTGDRPYIYPAANAAGAFSPHFNFYKNARVENLTIDMKQTGPGFVDRGLRLYKNASVTFKGCEIIHDRSASFSTMEDSTKLYVEDCLIHSVGANRTNPAGNQGRMYDCRNKVYSDSAIFTNCTFFYFMDRFVRILDPKHKYFKMDHCTFIDGIGLAGTFILGKSHEVTITNNVFGNVACWGTRLPELFQMEQNEPFAEKYRMWVMILDTIYRGDTSKINIKNNNIYWDQQIKNIWATRGADSLAKYPGTGWVFAPGVITPTIMQKIGADSVNAYFAEPLTFKIHPEQVDMGTLTTGSWFKFVDSTLKTWKLGGALQPENFYYGTQQQIDLSYGTTATSYTKASNGLPLGDLNWYPAKKAIWLTTGVEKDAAQGVPTTSSLTQNYPNPFNPTTTFNYQVGKAGFVSVKIYDLLGREMATLVNEVKQAGTYPATWNAAGFGSGIYFCKMQSGSFVATKKMILMK